MFRADLHCHTTSSDGHETPLQIVQMAAKLSLQGLSITDHDTVDAYTPEVFAEAERLGVALLPGCEISSQKEGIPVHILGYGIDLEHEGFRSFLQKIQEMRTSRNQQILHKLSQHRMPITEKELLEFAPHRTVGRPHIAALMVKKGYVRSIQDAFQRYLKEEAPCYAPGVKHTPEEAIAQIHQAGGKAVLAHPHFFKSASFVRRLLQLPFDGIECFYARLPKEQEAPWVKKAQERGLIATGGSDYHGIAKRDIALGSSWVDEETFRKLLKKK